MHGYDFTERSRRVLTLAREEAAALNHEYVGTEHILLGLIAEGQGVALTLLRNFGVDPGELASRLHQLLKPGRADRRHAAELPFTPRAKKALELALQEMRELNHSYAGTEHLLLGLIREEKGIAAQVLTAAGLQIDKARAELLRLLGMLPDSGFAAYGGVWLEGAAGRRIDSVEISLRFDDGEVRQRSFPTARAAAEYLLRGSA
jgi:ATP-dependent Clp protease ATP-binding subunit ClpC